MFCSWKKSPTAPCSCAYRLRSPLHELLNHLCHLGQGTLVLRRPGLSLAKSTPFGLHITERASGWTLLRDSISGLETAMKPEQNVYLMTDVADRRPLFAMGPPDKPIELSVRLEGHRWESPAIQQMITRFDGISLDCIESHRLGAGAWLDEWEQARKTTLPITSDFIHATSGILHRCQSLEVEIHTSMHRNAVRFQPSFIDSEGTVLRIADKTRTHIVYADVSARDFHLHATESRSLLLTHSA